MSAADAFLRGLSFFDPRPDGRYVFCPEGLFRPRADGAAGLRAGLDFGRLRSCGFTGGPADLRDEILETAITGGVLSHPAFLDIVDVQLIRAPCFCCYYTRSRERAADVEAQVGTILEYFTVAAYANSNLYYRNICALCRDVSKSEVGDISYHLGRGPKDGGEFSKFSGEVRALNRLPGICAIELPHDSSSIWIYSTPESRRLFRRLYKACKQKNLTLSARVASSRTHPSVHRLRHRLRIYALTCLDPAGSKSPAAFRKVITTTLRRRRGAT